MDVRARTTAQYLAKELGATVIVENVEGAGGQLGTTEYLKEKENTNTILLTDAWLLTVTPLIGKTDYSIEDYIPIIDHNVTDFCLFANPKKTGISSFEDLQNYAKDNKVLFASGGVGTSLYIIQKTMLDLLAANSDTITQTSASEGIVNLMAGTVDIAMSTFKGMEDYVKNGDVVPILWFGESAHNDEVFGMVPAATEKGLDIIYKGFYYYSIRKGTDPKIVDLLHNAFENVYLNPDFQADCAKAGYAPAGMTSQEINSYLVTFGNMAKNTFSLK